MSRNPSLLGLVLALLVGVVPVVSGVAVASARTGPVLMEPTELPAASSPAATPVEPPAVAVVRAWDDARAEAWARGDPRLLATLYTPASVAGRRDRAMLRAWTARGLVARALLTQLISVREVRRTASTWTLLVTDRLAGGVAVGRAGRQPLPRDAASTRTVRLRLLGGRWRVAAVVPGEVMR